MSCPLTNRDSAAVRRSGPRNVSCIVALGMCHGCGACAYVCSRNAIELRDFVDDGIRPVVNDSECAGCGDCISVCSGTHLAQERRSPPLSSMLELTEEWGPVLELWEGHACDTEIRFRGGSGGVATALGLCCVERQGMHGVLHVGMDHEKPHLNRTVFSRTREDLVACTGSRYSPAAVCGALAEIENAPAPCAMIAKPCEIAAAQMARAIRPGLDQNLGLTVSIFCGGTPSTSGTLALLGKLGTDPGQIRSLRYRGCGWPGMTGVELKAGGPDRLEMTYQEAWDTILTKHKPLRCQLCPDGTGEFADIACGDPWYRPIECGEKGTTLIVVRTERGRRILHEAIQADYVQAEPRRADVLPRSQKGLLNRRRHVWPKLAAFRLLRVPTPRFSGFSLWRGWLRLRPKRRLISLYRALRRAAGWRRRAPQQYTDEQIQSALPVHRPQASSTVREAPGQVVRAVAANG